jgi:hypothetical protein
MLDSKELVTRVTTCSRAERKTVEFARATVELAKDLKRGRYADKTATRIITDSFLSALEYLNRGDGISVDDQVQLRVKDSSTVSGMDVINVHLSLSPERWALVVKSAAQLEWPVSRLLRVVGFIAVEQVHRELTGRRTAG